MSWLTRLLPKKICFNGSSNTKRKGVPEGLWTKCESCQALLYSDDLTRALNVCPKCDFHHSLSAHKRLNCFLDADTPQLPIIPALSRNVDRLKFKDSKKYKDRLSQAQKLTGEKDALVAVEGSLYQMPIVVASFEFSFIGGSMGAVVGETFVQAVERSLATQSPFVCFTASGGARMQEGLVSLLQMAKTSAALANLAQAKIPFISVLTNPTMGGVSASLAMLGDIILAEPLALIGFAGPRVIAQTVKETLPEGFQRSEFLFEHGHIDQIVHRKEMRSKIAKLLAKLTHRHLTETTPSSINY